MALLVGTTHTDRFSVLDSDGTPVPGVSFTADAIYAPSGLPFDYTVTDLGGGLYDASFTVTADGTYYLRLVTDDVPGFPVSVYEIETISNPSGTAQTLAHYFSVLDEDGGYVSADPSAMFTVEEAVGPNDTSFIPTIGALGDGLYRVSWAAPWSGTYTLRLLADLSAVGGDDQRFEFEDAGFGVPSGVAGRHITGVLYHVDGTPWTNALVCFEMRSGPYTVIPQATYPGERQGAFTDETGFMEIDLTAGLGIWWVCHLPDGDAFQFALNTGSDITIEQLRAEAEGKPVPISYPTAEIVITAPVEGQILRHNGLQFVNIDRFDEPITPDYQNLPIDADGIDVIRTSDAPGNNFVLAVQVRSEGTRNTVAIFGQGVADGDTAKVWGGNFVAYANHATANDVIGVEINYGKQVPSTGGAYGLVVAASSPAGVGNNPTAHIQLQSNRDDAVPEDGIIFRSRESEGGGDVASGALIKTAGETYPSTDYGINFANAEFQGSAFATPNDPKIRARRTDLNDTHVFINFDSNNDVIINSSASDNYEAYPSGVGIIVGVGRTFRINNGADTSRLVYDADDDRFTVSAPLDVTGTLAVQDGITAPDTRLGRASIYVDTADGDLKVKFGDGTVKTIVVDT